jgi:hypothetical protein
VIDINSVPDVFVGSVTLMQLANRPNSALVYDAGGSVETVQPSEYEQLGPEEYEGKLKELTRTIDK